MEHVVNSIAPQREICGYDLFIRLRHHRHGDQKKFSFENILAGGQMIYQSKSNICNKVSLI